MPVVRIDPVVRLHLAAAGERHQHAVGHVLLRQAELAGPRLVDVDVQLGHVHHLVQVDVRDAAESRGSARRSSVAIA